MKHVFHPDTLSEITHHLWDVVESFGKDCKDIWNKQDTMSPGNKQ